MSATFAACLIMGPKLLAIEHFIDAKISSSETSSYRASSRSNFDSDHRNDDNEPKSTRKSYDASQVMEFTNNPE